MGPAPAHGRIRLATPQQTDLPESACRGGGVLWRHVGGARLPHAHPALILHPFYGGITLTTTPDESWGFLHPECFGRNALVFFSWDLARTIEQQFKLHEQSSIAIRLHEAQKAVDRLLKQYVQIQANPEAFEGESIELHLEPGGEEPSKPVLALKTSPKLEALILEAQAHEKQQAQQRPS